MFLSDYLQMFTSMLTTTQIQIKDICAPPNVPSCPSSSVPPHTPKVTRILVSVTTWLHLFLNFTKLESDNRCSFLSGFWAASPRGSSLLPHVPEVCSFYCAALPGVNAPQWGHSCVARHLGWFPFLTIMNKAALNILRLHGFFYEN